MECDGVRRGDGEELVEGLYRRAFAARVPLYGGMELTRRCNLRCVHCYVERDLREGAGRAEELTTSQWKALIDEVVDQGCMHFLMTGGEPMLRPDFGEVYSHAREKGLLVTVFTNGTLVTEKVLDILTDLKPRKVEVSLYGATTGTYEAVTGVKGSYDRCLRGIEALLARGVNVGLKTILMTVNRHEFRAMRTMAEGLGCKFRFDAAIFPRFDGDKAPVALRVSPGEVVALEMEDPVRRADWLRLFERQKNIPTGEGLYRCGSGITSFHIDASGLLRPCLMVRDLGCTVRDGGFAEGWRDVMPRLHEKRPAAGYACGGCEKQALCGYCPPFAALETGDDSGYSAYLCQTGELRIRAVMES